ncbi:MAG: YjfB family protein [Chthoniobacterales bacterium]|nr:YjfB family protein [Chthoniobacterales bacterium]
MTIIDNRVNPQANQSPSPSGVAVGQDVSIALLKKQLDLMKIQGAGEVKLLESANIKPQPTPDGKAGTIFSAYA